MRWDIGSVYKYIRKSKGITQNEVCGDYITHSNLSKFENIILLLGMILWSCF